MSPPHVEDNIQILKPSQGQGQLHSQVISLKVTGHVITHKVKPADIDRTPDLDMLEDMRVGASGLSISEIVERFSHVSACICTMARAQTTSALSTDTGADKTGDR